MRTKQIIPIIIFSLFITSCDKEEIEIDSIYHTWSIKSIHTVESIFFARVPKNPIFISFHQDQTYTLLLDVNECNGSIHVGQDNSLSFGSGICSAVCCDSEFSEKLSSMLSQIFHYEIYGTRLILYAEDGFIKTELHP